MSSAPTVLFDTLGPRGRARSRTVSIVATLAFVAVALLIGFRLADTGQFTEEKLGPLFNPGNENFTLLWTFLGAGLYNTLLVAAIAVVVSVSVGTVLAVCRVSAAPWYRWFIVTVIETFRAIPVVLLVYAASRVLPAMDTPLPLMWYLVIGIVLYNSVSIAEIIRGGIAALPRGQREAAESLGLSRFDTMRRVILPQAFKMMLPALISQIAIAVKETSLGFVISFEELLRRGQIAIQTLNNPLQMFFVIGVIYIVINYSVGRAARAVEKRTSTSRPAIDARSDAPESENIPLAVMPGRP